MRLLIIYPSDPLGPKVGGGESFLKGLIKNAPFDFEIEFIGVTSNPGCPLKRWADVKIGGKRIKFFPVLFEKDENRKAIIPLALRFTAALQTCKIDYSVRLLFFNRLEPAVLFKNVPSPKILVVHNDIEKQIKQKGSEVFWSQIPWLYFKLERYIFGCMNQIYTVSQNSLMFYQGEYSYLKGRISFLSTWVDNIIFSLAVLPKAVIREELGFADKARRQRWILFVGRLQEQKSPLRLVDTLKLYAQDDLSVRLIMIGEGNMQSKIEEYVERLGLRQQVIFFKSMPQEKLVKFYQAADVLLLTSNFEGMPMCVLESLGCGVPVVTTDVGEVRRVVKNKFSGEVVESFDPEDIARAVKKVLDNPQVYTPGNCTKSVEDYTPQKVLVPVYDKIRELYKEKYVAE